MLYKLVTFDNVAKDGSGTVWAIVNEFDHERILSLTQYIMNGSSHPEEFWYVNEENKKAYKLIDLAAKHGIHKQTFEERMSGK